MMKQNFTIVFAAFILCAAAPTANADCGDTMAAYNWRIFHASEPAKAAFANYPDVSCEQAKIALRVTNF